MKRLFLGLIKPFLIVLAFPVLAAPPYINQLIEGNGGLGVAAQGEWLIVGEPEVCRAYVYRLDYDTMLYGDGGGAVNPGEGGCRPGGWYQCLKAEFSPSCPSVQDRGYGEAVAIDGDLIAVGAPEAKGALSIDKYGELLANQDGAVFLYRFSQALDQWTPIAQTAEALDDAGEPTNVDGARFGSALSLLDELLVVGAPFDSDGNGGNPPPTGKVYFYQVPEEGGGPEQLGALVGENVDDTFGFSVGTTQGQVMVGVPGFDLSDPEVSNAGAAYLYDFELVANTIDLTRTDLITIPFDFGDTPSQGVGIEVSVGPDIGLLAGLASYPLERVGGNVVPKFQYSRTNGGDVSQSEGVSAFGITSIGVDIYPDVLNDNADQSSNYHLEIELVGSPAVGDEQALATDIRLYKDTVVVNDNPDDRVQVLHFPSNFGGPLDAEVWDLVGVPGNHAAAIGGMTVEEAFNADIFPDACAPIPCGVLGEYGVNWEVWGQVDDYTSPQPTVKLAATDTIEVGKGYWIKSDASLKPVGQPVYWNVSDTNFSSPQDARLSLDTTLELINLADEVGGYLAVPMPGDVPDFEEFGLMVGNPFGRAINWANVGVTVTSAFAADADIFATDTADSFLLSITAYRYNPDITEGQPYEVISAVPGLSSGQILVNEGVWLRIFQTGFIASISQLLLSFEK